MRVLTDRDTGDEGPSLHDLDVLNWRFEELVRAGYPVDVAVSLSSRADVDLHQACDLIGIGASVTEALRILL
jgi:hypothetical protein